MEEQNNVNVEEKKEEKVTYKKHGFVYWLVIVLGMGFIVFMSVRMGEKIAEEKIEKNGGKTTTVTSNSNSNKPEEKSNEVTADEKAKINDLMSLLFSNAKIENNFIKVTSLSDIWAPIFKGNVSEVDLLKSLIMGARDKDVVAYTAKNGTFSDTYKTMEKGGAILATKLNEYYKKLTGKEITSYVDLPLGCPMYAYDSTNKMYVEVVGCGGVSSAGQILYLDSYTKNDNTIVVSAYVGGYFDAYEEGTTIYADYYESENSDNIKVFQKSKTLENFKIDESNKTSFTKYNFTFEKASDGEYYFKNVTKAN